MLPVSPQADVARDDVGAIPAGTPAWITPELIRLTQKVWNPRYKTTLSRDEAITIILSVGRLFDLFSRERTA
jgi:hypothetical protein